MFKIRSIDSFPNVFQNEHFTKPFLKDFEGKEIDLKGKWRSDVFKNQNALVLELACGKGDYALALAKKFPGKNFLGVDSKGARIFTGSKTALDQKLGNIAFARMRIENIINFFNEGEVDEIWITFPDPFPNKKDAKRRLSAPKFIERYKLICKPGATVHFKTDDLPLFRFTKQTVEELGLKTLYYKEVIYSAPLEFEELNIQTYYEKKHLVNARTINYISFQL
ncbi:MAG: tRNA ((46)-N7)-methyltransferase TrmB [Bacteroidota bacterium]|nr:tRNA ((46)-N7)-methyltransferase TrmB [Bacteroidota bacterium]